MQGRLGHLWQLWQHFGAAWVGYRVKYALALRSGLIRRQLPATSWVAQPLDRFLIDARLGEPAHYLAYRQQEAPPFFFSTGDQSHFRTLFSQWDQDKPGPEAEADALLAGTFRYFDHATATLGFPPAWNRNPFTSHTTPTEPHWSQLPDFDYGDIKVIWEPSRFGAVYTLVRAYWRSGDERYAEGFWCLVEDWQQHNPPQQGANWKCGQETSLRVAAWCFGLYGFLNSPASTAPRVSALAQMIALSGVRIEANISYALSQRNNHAITEAMGLWTIGILFPEFKRAAAWRDKGYRLLASLASELIYEDGSFVQHSVNYHRLMLDAYLWALRLGELHGQPFSAPVQERVNLARSWLYQLQDEQTGQLPYYGQNDGALFLPLNGCDYQDFRPVLQATHYLFHGNRCYAPGPWDESLLWFFGAAALEAPQKCPPRTDMQAQVGGYYTIRDPEGFAFIRCATFQDRPGQADMLHVDLWWRGQNIALDAGTYSYNAPAPWNNPLAHTAYHNTAGVAGYDQMNRAGKFLWLPWLHSRVRFHCTSGKGLTYWEGSQDGYERLAAPVTCERAIVHLGRGTWVVIDRLMSQTPHPYRLHWLCPDVDHEWVREQSSLRLKTDAGDYYLQTGSSGLGAEPSLVRADPESPRGWRAPYYHYREPALSLELKVVAPSTTFYTLFSPLACQIAWAADQLRLQAADWQATLHLVAEDAPRSPIVSSVLITGSLEDRLEIPLCTPS